MRSQPKKRSFTKGFFQQQTLEVAQKLLGAKLWTNHGGIYTSGMIVEVEAYRDEEDEASHSFRGLTERNKVMFQEGGHCYVYFIYGAHYCVNVVTEPQERGCAVLVRALQPLEGLGAMQRRRKTINEIRLTNGPAKLCEALRINMSLNGEDLRDSKRIGIEPFKRIQSNYCLSSQRIGISKSTHLPWRFYIKDNPWVSKLSPLRISPTQGRSHAIRTPRWPHS